MVHDVARAATTLKFHLLDKQIHIARKKSRAMGSHARVRNALAAKLGPGLGATAAVQERNLGIDTSCGRRAGRSVRRDRLKEGADRSHRLRTALRPRRKAQAVVAKAGMLPAMSYGVEVTGLSDWMRQEAECSWGSSQGLRANPEHLPTCWPDSRPSTLSSMPPWGQLCIWLELCGRPGCRKQRSAM